MVTLGQFVEGIHSTDDSETSDLRTLVLDLARACRAIGERLASPRRHPTTPEVLDELVLLSNDTPGWVADLLARLDAGPRAKCYGLRSRRHLVLFLPLDSPANAAVNAGSGTIFSVLRTDAVDRGITARDFLQRGGAQVCAGYAIHGPSIELVLAVAGKVQRFSPDGGNGEFVLTDADLRILHGAREIAIDSSNARFWSPAIRRYVNECLAGESGPRGADFQFHWSSSIVAEAHRILVRGGVFICTRERGRLGQEPWLLCEANPVAFVIEQAGGRASTGTQRVLDLDPNSSSERTPLIFGVSTEVARIEGYLGDNGAAAYDAPLFGERGLFRIPA